MHIFLYSFLLYFAVLCLSRGFLFVLSYPLAFRSASVLGIFAGYYQSGVSMEVFLVGFVFLVLVVLVSPGPPNFPQLHQRISVSRGQRVWCYFYFCHVQLCFAFPVFVPGIPCFWLFCLFCFSALGVCFGMALFSPLCGYRAIFGCRFVCFLVDLAFIFLDVGVLGFFVDWLLWICCVLF